MLVNPGPHKSIPLYPKPANVCIFLSNWREQAYHHTNYYIFTQQQSAQFLSMPPQLGTTLSLACKLSSWNQYKRAVHIVFNFIRGMSYSKLLFVANINSLKDWRDEYSRSFFQTTCNLASCLHHLLPPPPNTSVTSGLHSSLPLPRPTSRTKKFQSFVNFALSKY